MKSGFYALLFFTFLLILLPSLDAATIVGGTITTDTIWTEANSPYIVQQSILVVNGATLTIEPSVIVQFCPTTGLSVANGSLVARGTETSNIVFTANASPPDAASNRWGYIGFWDLAQDATFGGDGNYASGCILEYVVVEYAGGANTKGAIHSEYCSPFISKCLIRLNSDGGINFNYSPNSIVRNNSIFLNKATIQGGGIDLQNSSNVVLTGNTIAGNSSTFAGGISLYRASSTILTGNTIASNYASRTGCIRIIDSPNTILIGNTIVSNVCQSDGAITVIDSSNVTLTVNVISNNATTGFAPDTSSGIYMNNSPRSSLIGNAFSGNFGGGITLSFSPYTVLIENTVTYNSATNYSINGGGISINNTPNAILTRNTIANNFAINGGGIALNFSSNVFLINNIIASNSATYGGGIYVLSSLIGTVIHSESTRIFANSGQQIYNASVFKGSFVPQGAGNVDARSIWWGTTNAAEIQNEIYDYFDDSGKGIVFYEPFFLGWAIYDVPIYWLQDFSLGTNDATILGDQDGDGSPTWQEFFAGTNPTNSTSVFKITGSPFVEMGNTVLNWLSVSNKNYSIEVCPNLTTGEWDAVISGIPGNPPMNTVTVQVEMADALFFRIKTN